MSGDFGNVTNYNKAQMQELADKISQYQGQYNDIIARLTQHINEMHNFWGEDPDAEALYQQLLSQYQEYRKQFDEGSDMMQEFKRQVDSQVGRYEEAESTTKGVIG